LSAEKELRLAQRAIRQAITHLEQARGLNPLPESIRGLVKLLEDELRGVDGAIEPRVTDANRHIARLRQHPGRAA
jgi:hypothetical protein